MLVTHTSLPAFLKRFQAKIALVAVLVSALGIGMYDVPLVGAADGDQRFKAELPAGSPTTFYVGRCFRVNFTIQSDNMDVEGAEIEVPFDTDTLAAYSDSNCTAAATELITTGSVFASDDFIGNSISSGVIETSAFVGLGGDPINTGAAPNDALFGYIYFKVLDASASETLTFNFSGTTDTNMTQPGGGGVDEIDGVDGLPLALEADSTDPTFSSISPSNGATGIAVNGTTLSFTMSDAGAGIDESSVTATLDGSSVSVTCSPASDTNSNKTPSCSVSSAALGTLKYGATYTLVLSGDDEANSANTGTSTTTFTTESDTTGPFVVPQTPADAATGVATNQSITLDIRDYIGGAGGGQTVSGTGVDIATVSIDVTPTGGSTTTYTYDGNSGTETFSYTGTATDYAITIPAPDPVWDEYTEVTVEVTAEDDAGNSISDGSDTYTFTTIDTTNPLITIPQVEVSNSAVSAVSATDVDFDTNITFRITDATNPGSGVDMDGVTVTVTPAGGSATAYTTADAEMTAVASGTGYNVTINPSSDFAEYTNITVSIVADDEYGNTTSPNPYTFSFLTDDVSAPYVTNRNPDDSENGVNINSNIVFHVLDAGDGVDLSTISVGVTPSGSGTTTYTSASAEFSSSGTDSDYTITINPAFNFNENTEVDITVDASDVNGQAMTTDAYSFTTSDSVGPVLSNFSPTQGAEGVSASTDISFNIDDSGTGIDFDNTTVTVEGVTYSNSGPNQYTITDRNPGNANHNVTLTINPSSDFSASQEVDVSITVQDSNSTPNSTNDSYSFTIGASCSTCAVSGETPERWATEATMASSFSFHLTDSGEGIDADSIQVKLIGTGAAVPYSPLTITGGTVRDDAIGLSVSGSSDDYTVTVTLADTMEDNVPYGVIISASDVNGLTMEPVAYTFMNDATQSVTTITTPGGTTISCGACNNNSNNGGGGGRGANSTQNIVQALQQLTAQREQAAQKPTIVVERERPENTFQTAANDLREQVAQRRRDREETTAISPIVIDSTDEEDNSAPFVVVEDQENAELVGAEPAEIEELRAQIARLELQAEMEERRLLRVQTRENTREQRVAAMERRLQQVAFTDDLVPPNIQPALQAFNTARKTSQRLIVAMGNSYVRALNMTADAAVHIADRIEQNATDAMVIARGNIEAYAPVVAQGIDQGIAMSQVAYDYLSATPAGPTAVLAERLGASPTQGQSLSTQVGVMADNVAELGKQVENAGIILAENLTTGTNAITTTRDRVLRRTAEALIALTDTGDEIINRTTDNAEYFARRVTDEQVNLPPQQHYRTALFQENTRTLVATIQMNIFDGTGAPVSNRPVVLFSTPMIAFTDDAGVATFHNVETGKHHLEVHLDENRVERREIIIEQPSSITDKQLEDNDVDVVLPVIRVVVGDSMHASASSRGLPIFVWVIGFLLVIGNIALGYILFRERKTKTTPDNSSIVQ